MADCCRAPQKPRLSYRTQTVDDAAPRATVYARISLDRKEEAGVKRQENEVPRVLFRLSR